MAAAHSTALLAAGSLLALALAGCASTETAAPAAAPGAGPVLAAAPSPHPPESFVGRWGLASFHQAADRARTETLARQQCGNPYVINRGPNGGLMMYVADDSELRELRVTGAAGGRTFIGPNGPPGGDYDREILSFDGKVMVSRWTDEEFHGRYGTMVMVRCT
jgi:hypothetical protein